MATDLHKLNDLMDRGIPYDDALHRIKLGDLLFDRSCALDAAEASATEYLCNALDGWAGIDLAAYGDAVSKLDAAWRDYREAVEEAQRIEPVDIAAGERGK